MAFSEVASLDADVTVALGKTDKKTGKAYPKQAEGYYLGKREVESKKGQSFLHFLQTAKGNLGVWGTNDLNRKLGQVTPGTMVRITSTGTKETPRGDMYTYRVEIDNDNTIEVSASDTTYASDGNDGHTNSDEESYDDNTNYGNGADEDTQQDLALAAAKRKADVEALLKSRSKKT